ncbi:MAG: hypothetical protein ACI94Y_002930 [Maribacter sp.]|jgi:hypothetical protein
MKRYFKYISDFLVILLKRPYIISSFPKAGSTLCRMMIYNYFRLEKGESTSVLHDIVNEKMPELGKGNCNKATRPLLIKSHLGFKSYPQNKVMRIIRNPYDSLCSAYEYYNRSSALHFDHINDFIHHEKGIEHYESHLILCEQNNKNQQGLVVFYENLVEDKRSQLEQMLTFLGEKSNTDFILKTVNLTSRENMAKSEDKKKSTTTKNFSKAKDYTKYKSKINSKNQARIALLEKRYEILKQLNSGR